jgi:hypothetical protein
MRRLLQFGTVLLVLIAFLAPLAECFDHWDPPGPENDTEFALFALIFVLCLVLLVSKLIAALAQWVNLVVSGYRRETMRWIASRLDASLEIIPPLRCLPLRI